MAKPSFRASLGPALVLAALLLAVVAAFVLVGRYESRRRGFDWELASIFGTAVGTVLLALATAFLASTTRAEVQASRQELELSRGAFQASTRPVLLEAPRDVFTVEKEAIGFSPRPIGEGGIPRRIHDLGLIEVEAGEVSGETEAIGYARITVPLQNVGAGLALIHGARVLDFTDWPLQWRASMDTGAPPGQLARVSFGADIDGADGQVLGFELEDGDFSFSVEVDYSDLSGDQRTRTRLKIRGRRSYWNVTMVELFRADDEEPFVVLHRQADSSEPPAAAQ